MSFQYGPLPSGKLGDARDIETFVWHQACRASCTTSSRSWPNYISPPMKNVGVLKMPRSTAASVAAINAALISGSRDEFRSASAFNWCSVRTADCFEHTSEQHDIVIRQIIRGDDAVSLFQLGGPGKNVHDPATITAAFPGILHPPIIWAVS